MVSSRLARHEQSKYLKQTMIIGGLAIVLLILFLFVILPQVVRLAANVLDSNPISEFEDTIPPQVPIVSAPVSATYSAQLLLKGVGEPKSQVVVIVNSDELDKITVNDSGEFTVEVPLTEGENSITLHSVDEAGNESVKSQTYTIMLDTEAPTISMEKPHDGEMIELRKNQVTDIVGTTEPNAQVLINDRLVYANGAGQFTLKYQLQEGENILKIKAIDAAGNHTEIELKVSFRV